MGCGILKSEGLDSAEVGVSCNACLLTSEVFEELLDDEMELSVMELLALVLTDSLLFVVLACLVQPSRTFVILKDTPLLTISGVLSFSVADAFLLSDIVSVYLLFTAILLCLGLQGTLFSLSLALLSSSDTSSPGIELPLVTPSLGDLFCNRNLFCKSVIANS